MILRGGCHCGALTVEFETAMAADELPLRECQCSFCRKHGACNTSDPKGHTRIVAAPDALVRYRFGLRTADFLMCARCGVYIGCVLDDAFSSVNTRVLAHDFTQAPLPKDWSGETTSAARVDRRRANWTPTTVELRM